MPPRPRTLDFQPWPSGPTVDLTPIQRNDIAVSAFGRENKLTDEVWKEVLEATSFFTIMDISRNQPLVTKVLPKLSKLITAAKSLKQSMIARRRIDKPPRTQKKAISPPKSATPTTLGEAIMGTYFENPRSPTAGNLPLFLVNLLDGLIPLATLMEHDWKQKRGRGVPEGAMWDHWIRMLANILRKHGIAVAANNDLPRRKQSGFVIFVRELQEHIPGKLRKSEAEYGLPKAINRALAGTQQLTK